MSYQRSAWTYVEDYARRCDVDLEPWHVWNLGLPSHAKGRLRDLGLRYQSMAGALAWVNLHDRPAGDIIIETGVGLGVSTFFLLHAAAERGAMVHSCDPVFASQGQALEEIQVRGDLGLAHADRWRFRGEASTRALRHERGCRVFVHDSDHSPRNMTFEMEFAWRVLEPDGLLIIDDYLWPRQDRNPHASQPHRAVDRWCATRRLEYAVIDTACVLEVPRDKSAEDPDAAFSIAMALASTEDPREVP